MNINSLLRDNIRQIKPYSSARSEFSGPARIYLDANENSFGSTLDGAYHRYPDPLQKNLKNRLADIKETTSDRIFIGHGSDEAIDLLFRAFCQPGVDQAIILPPTYGMYRVSADINDVEVLEIQLTPEYELNLPAIMAVVSDRTKLLFICSPNNPTGNYFKADDIQKLVEIFPGLVILDEAYIDFCPDKSFLPRIAEYPRLVILQTFSKAWGLAGLRVGMAFADPSIIAIFNKIKPPYNVSSQSQQLARQALDHVTEKNAMVADILSQRSFLQEKLDALPFVSKVYPSDANFLLVKMDRPKSTYDYLVAQGIIVRDRSRVVLCEGCLRITVGTPAENKELIACLQKMELTE